MVKKRRQRPLPIPPRPRRRPWSREFRLQLAVIVGFVLLLVGIAAGFGYFQFQDWYEEHIQRPHSKAVQVGETTFDLDYFARRLRLLVAEYGLQEQPEQASLAVSLMVSTLEGEELLRQRAPADLGVSVSPGEIELEISDRLGLSQSDPETFDRVYEQELEGSDLSDEPGHSASRLVLHGDPATLAPLLVELREQWAGRLRVLPIRPGFIGVFGPEVDKGDALRFVAARLGVTAGRTVACGDGTADEGLLAAASVRIAVGEEPHVLGHLPYVVVTDRARLPEVLLTSVLPLL